MQDKKKEIESDQIVMYSKFYSSEFSYTKKKFSHSFTIMIDEKIKNVHEAKKEAWMHVRKEKQTIMNFLMYLCVCVQWWKKNQLNNDNKKDKFQFPFFSLYFLSCEPAEQRTYIHILSRLKLKKILIGKSNFIHSIAKYSRYKSSSFNFGFMQKEAFHRNWFKLKLYWFTERNLPNKIKSPIIKGIKEGLFSTGAIYKSHKK